MKFLTVKSKIKLKEKMTKTETWNIGLLYMLVAS